MSQKAQLVCWQRGVLGRNQWQVDFIAYQPAALEELGNKRRLPRNPLHNFRPQDKLEGQNCSAKAMYWETNWAGGDGLANFERGEDFEAGRPHSGQSESGSFKQVPNRPLRARARLDRQLRRKDLQDNLWNPWRSWLISGTRQVIGLQKWRIWCMFRNYI